MSNTYALKLFLYIFLVAISWSVGYGQQVNPSPSKSNLLNKPWYVANVEFESLIGSLDSSQLSTINGTFDRQTQFIIEDAEEGDENNKWFYIRHRASGKYVTVSSQIANTAVVLENFSNDHNKQFKLLVGGVLDRKKIRSRLSSSGNNLNLQVQNTGVLIVNNPNASSDQSFSFFQSTPNNITERYAIVGANKGHFVSDMGLKVPGIFVRHIQESDYSVIWNFEKTNDGYYYIQNFLTKQYISNNNTTDNQSELAMSATKNENTKWSIEYTDGGIEWRIKNKVSEHFFSTRGQNDDGDPVYQAGVNSSGVRWFIVPLEDQDPIVAPASYNSLLDEVMFPPTELGIPILDPLLVSIGLPNIELFKSTVWKSLMQYYGSASDAEDALRNYNSNDVGHRAEMALAVRKYVVDYLPSIDKSDWCTDEVALVDSLEAKAKELRISFANRSYNAWVDFKNTPAFEGSNFLNLLYGPNAADFEAVPIYEVSPDQSQMLLEFSQKAQSAQFVNEAFVNLGASVLATVGGSAISGLVLNALAKGLESATITVLSSSISGSSVALGSAVASAAGVVTVVIMATQILVAQVQSVIAFQEFDEKMALHVSNANAINLDLHAIMNGVDELEKIQTLQDLDVIFGAPDLLSPMDNILHPDGASFLPNISCPSNHEVFLSQDGCFNSDDINVPAGSDCAVDQEGVYFDLNIGPNQTLPVGGTTLKYISKAGTELCSYTITVVDQAPPIITSCPSSFTTLAFDSCQSPAFWSSPLFRDCQAFTISSNFESGDVLPVGVTVVNYTATDASNNSTNCSFSVTLTERISIPPTALCVPDFSVVLDEYGESDLGDIYPEEINADSYDNCSDVTLAIEPNPFFSNGVSCSNIDQPKIFTLKVTDSSGNESICTTAITAVDTIPPVAECQDQTVFLHAFTGTATLTEAQIGNNSYSLDDCETIDLELSKTEFNCDNLGSQQVLLTASDNAGNKAQCSANVNVIDVTPPIISCLFSKTIYLDVEGQATVIPSSLMFSGVDNCSLSFSYQLSKDTFSCADIGLNDVILTVSDASANGSNCQTIINVQDSIRPTAICRSRTIYLDTNGSATLNAAQVDMGSFDNCGDVSVAISQSHFTCADIGRKDITLTASDGVNSSSCICSLNIMDPYSEMDVIGPDVVCKGLQDITYSIDTPGISAISWAYTGANVVIASHGDRGLADFGPNATTGSIVASMNSICTAVSDTLQITFASEHICDLANCTETINITTDAIESGLLPHIFKAGINLISNARLTQNHFEFNAGSQIIFDKGFSMPNGSSLVAQIKDCDE